MSELEEILSRFLQKINNKKRKLMIWRSQRVKTRMNSLNIKQNNLRPDVIITKNKQSSLSKKYSNFDSAVDFNDDGTY